MLFTSDERICSVDSPFGPNALLLSHMTGEEELSSLFCLKCEVLSPRDDLRFDEIIGKSITLELRVGAGVLARARPRYFNGVVSRFAQGGRKGRYTSYSLDIVPWLWFLTLSSDCRIFQGKSVPVIIEEVMKEYSFADVDTTWVKGEHQDRNYCVQYRETDFNFLSRLMEEEGIGYYFRHTANGHTCVLFDTPAGNEVCAGQPTATYATTVAGDTPVGDLDGWDVEQEMHSGAYSTTDYNMEDPVRSPEKLLATRPTAIAVGGNESFEVFDYPGEHQLLDQGELRVQLRMEAEEAGTILARSESTCAAFAPGLRFDLTGHYRYDDTWLLCEVTHEITQDVGESGGEGSSYGNSIECMPYDVPYRPPQRTPKPVISGVQTATVVGPAGEEIYTDPFGRVKVQFHWDRRGEMDENSSCWIRVSQNWAGKGWGAVSLPRIGQEVIVDFLEGDPDRPIITGRVYNAEQTIPYSMPDSKTQTGFKTRSSMGGGGENFNEIRFEDKKGSESLSIHAEKDLSATAEANQTVSVGADRTVTVGGNETILVKGSEGRKATIDNGDDFLEVKTGDRKIEVNTGDYSNTVKTGDHIVTVNAADAKLEVKTGDRIVGVNAGDYGVETKTGMISLKAKSDFKADSSSVAMILAPDVGIEGTSSAQITVGQAVAKLEPAKLTLSVGSSMVILDPSGVTITGVMVKIN